MKELSESELEKLAHEGTKEALEKLEKYIETEIDFEKRSSAQMALEECEMFYYEPKNRKEEDDFLLSELIRRRAEHIDDATVKVDAIRSNVERLMLEKRYMKKFWRAIRIKRRMAIQLDTRSRSNGRKEARRD